MSQLNDNDIKKLKEKLQNTKRYLDECKNDYLSGSCYEMCAMRENGMCELSETRIIIDCIEVLTGKKLENNYICNKFLKELIDITIHKS